MCSDLCERFNSPTVNLFIMPDQYLKLLKNLKHYMQCDMKEIKNTGYNYPVGLLGGDIELHFMHYKTFDEAKNKWLLRSKRINYDNLFIMMTDRDGCTLEQIIEFDGLSYKNKIVFTSHERSNINSAVYCSEFSSENRVGILTDFRGVSGKRIYDKYFDFVNWLNGNDAMK